MKLMFRCKLLAFSPAILALVFSSCGEPDPANLPVINTPANAKVDLSKVTLSISNAKITRINENKYTLNFDYTVTNHSGAHLAFPCLYDSTDDLIEVGLTDNTDQKLVPGKRPMEGLTLTEPRPLKIANGPVTRSYSVPIMPEVRDSGDLITLRVRLHAPSRYDELRSTVAAPLVQVPWP
ncbi:hypothetical protein NT6N_06410 [Oceaniferula spumae]|uniref:DUF1735 domain-containing protein n=1 Tax=Oceaniferula spumae TaxID=2979115 RepID=A0AAT9FI59_9BACT